MKIYTVRSGDTIYALARRFGLKPEELVYANQLQNPSVLSIGQSLVIPIDSVRYTVRRGDSLYRIAQRYGVTPAAVAAANPQLGSGERIYPGQVITIPFRTPHLGTAAVNGYITDARTETLNATLPYLTWLSPFSFRADAQGELTPTYSVATDRSAAYGTANLLTLTNLKEAGGFSGDIAHSILTDSDAQDNFLQNVSDLLDRGDWSGVNLDFEYVKPFDRESYNQFLRRFAERLHARGKLLVTAVAPKTSADQSGLLYAAHDYPAHGAAADYVVLMTYEWGYTYGPAMAVAPLDKVRRVLDYAVSAIPPEKILLGVPNYGYNWTLPFVQGSAAKALTNVAAVTLAGIVGAQIRFDEAAQSPYFNYTDAEGRRHEVWFEDARSLDAKYRLAAQYGLAGFSFWNLNNLFRPALLVLESLWSIEKAP